MFSIAVLIDRAKSRAGIESDYRLAKVLGITQASVSTWRMGKSLPNEKVIQQLAALSGDDADLIAAQIQAERSKDPEAKSLWLRVAARMAGGASTAILSLLISIVLIAGFAPPAWAIEARASISNNSPQCTSYDAAILSVGDFLRVRLRQIQRLFSLCLCCVS